MKLHGRNSQSEPQGIFNENLRRSFDKLTAAPRSNQASTITPQHRQKPQVQLLQARLFEKLVHIRSLSYRLLQVLVSATPLNNEIKSISARQYNPR